MTGIAMPADKLWASERCFEFRFAGTRVVGAVAGDEPILVAVSFAIDSDAIQASHQLRAIQSPFGRFTLGR